MLRWTKAAYVVLRQRSGVRGAGRRPAQLLRARHGRGRQLSRPGLLQLDDRHGRARRWRSNQARRPQNDASPSSSSASNEGTAPWSAKLDEGDWTTCTSPQTYEALNRRVRTPSPLRPRDAAGNLPPQPGLSYSWTIDTVAPTRRSTAAPADPTDQTKRTLRVLPASEDSTFVCSLDGAALADCESPQEYTPLAPGAHDFRVQATDRAGNVEAEPAAHAWQIESGDVSAPETSITDRPDDPTNNGSAEFAFTGSDDETAPAGLRFECRLDGQSAADYVSCSSPTIYPGLAAGSHTFDVTRGRRAGKRRARRPRATRGRSTWRHRRRRSTAARRPSPTARRRASASPRARPAPASSARSTAPPSPPAPRPAIQRAWPSPAHLPRARHRRRRQRGRHARQPHLDGRPDRAADDDRLRPARADEQHDAPASPSPPARPAPASSARSTAAAFAACTSPRQYSGLAASAHTFRVAPPTPPATWTTRPPAAPGRST